METLARMIKEKKITDKDVTTFIFIELYPLKSAKDLAIIMGKDYSRLTQSINRLLQNNLIIENNERPKKYVKNE